MQQIISSAAMRMTSREIAELVGSRHDKVKQSIERLATEKENKPAVICLPPLGEYLDSLGRPASEYIFSGEQGNISFPQFEEKPTAGRHLQFYVFEGEKVGHTN